MLNTLYELKEILLILLGIIVWFGAQLYVEKATREKVNIVLIELMTWVPLRKAALLICEGFCCLAFIKCFGGLVEDFKGGIVPYLLLTSCIIAFAVGIKKYFQRSCRCVIGCEYLDAKALKRSIESETFRKINDSIWESEHWLRLGVSFFPKSLITDMRFCIPLYRRSIGADVNLLYGDTYFEGALINEKENREKRISEQTMGILPVSRIINAKPEKYKGLVTSRCSISRKEFKEYIKNHTVEEILDGTELLEAVLDQYVK